jgi:hypothetical protein
MLQQGPVQQIGQPMMPPMLQNIPPQVLQQLLMGQPQIPQMSSPFGPGMYYI